MLLLPRKLSDDFLLTFGIAECFNSSMHLSNIFSILTMVLLCLALITNGFADDANPLQEALLDPLGFISPSSRPRNDALPPIFEAQRSDALNVSAKSEKPPGSADETAFERAAADWEEFIPAKFPLQEGSVFYGDPKMLTASVQREPTKDPQFSLGGVLPVVICVLGIIGTLCIFIRLRRRSKGKSFAS